MRNTNRGAARRVLVVIGFAGAVSLRPPNPTRRTRSNSCPTSSSPRRAPSNPRSTCRRRSTSVPIGDTTDTLGVNPSEFLDGVPGVLARDRQNYAQDEQISIRGFGARSTFGVRGVRLYTDGIPATMPDGQGQVSHFNLDSGDRIEVLRGPFSALYGNSSGGVIQLFTADGTDPGQIKTGLVGESYDTLARERERARRLRARPTTTSTSRISRPTAIATTAPRSANRATASSTSRSATAAS